MGANAKSLYLEERMEEQLEAGNLGVHGSGLEEEVRWLLNMQIDAEYANRSTQADRYPQQDTSGNRRTSTSKLIAQKSGCDLSHKREARVTVYLSVSSIMSI